MGCDLLLFVLWTPPPLPTGLSDRLALIITALRGVLAGHMAKDRSAVEVLFLAWTRLGRLALRFEKLVATVRAGRVPSAPAPRLQAERDFELPRLEGLPPPRLPGGFGWLIRIVPGTAAYSGQMQYLLADPEMAGLLADVPQAGRILRPLCRMLGIRAESVLFAGRREPPSRGEVPASPPAEGAGLGDSGSAAAEPLDMPLGSGSEPTSDPPPALELPVRPCVNAGADPPPNVPWRRAERG
ncbi:MAG: hypothetical protein JOY71_01060 [Acetobacteraceae bacterium]|nr:hypothetical protein [Acetobacteraceae bacterium]MBV8520718.1 hypothetical protein [Acetobacteraceae bacterium]